MAAANSASSLSGSTAGMATERQALKVKKLNSNAKLPSKAKKGDAGYDLFATSSGTILPGERVMIGTGLAFAIPEGYYGRISPRSGLALKHGIDILAGVVDSLFRGEVNVILINTSGRHEPQTKEFKYNVGDAIAQIIIQKCENFPVEAVEELDQTERGSGGFGSTGTRN